MNTKHSQIILCSFNIIPMEKTIYNSVYPPIAAKRGVSIPSYEEAAYSGSFMFLNSHPSVGTPFRLPQSVKYVGGYHIDGEVKPLPEVRIKLEILFSFLSLVGIKLRGHLRRDLR